MSRIRFELLKWYPSLPDDWVEGMLLKYCERRRFLTPENPIMDEKLPREEVLNQDEFWKKIKKKNYKIVEFLQKDITHQTEKVIELRSDGFMHYPHVKDNVSTLSFEDALEDPNCVIHAVKRVSDGKVFRREDRITKTSFSRGVSTGFVTIQSIQIKDKDPIFETQAGFTDPNDFDRIEHYIKTLTTTDGVQIKPGEYYYEVRGNSSYIAKRQLGKDPEQIEDSGKTFSTRSAAEKYLDLNKDQFSKVDINEAIVEARYRSDPFKFLEFQFGLYDKRGRKITE